MSPKKTKSKESNIYLRVLGYKKDTKIWAAHCLETDLVGYGKTFKAALDNLVELTEIQISFSVFKNEPALLDRPAPIEIIETYNYLVRKNLQYFNSSTKIKDKQRKITSIPFPVIPPKANYNFDSMQVS